jgi:membrane-bound lytic murein transglycosylase B
LCKYSFSVCLFSPIGLSALALVLASSGPLSLIWAQQTSVPQVHLEASPKESKMSGHTAQLAQPHPKKTRPGSSPSTSSKVKPKIKPIITETGPNFKRSPELLALAEEVASTQNLPLPWVQSELLKAKSLTKIKQLVLPPTVGVKKNWAAYRERFLSEGRIDAGQKFTQKNWDLLERAQARFQVPWEIMVAIIGVETFYGKNTGHFKALDVLTSLSMDFPKSHPRAVERETFFRQELGALLKLIHDNPKKVWLSSYAGALGLPQFMPSNWEKFALDGDADGKVDLMGSEADAIVSVGNYLAQFGWKAQMPTHYDIEQRIASTHLEEMLLPDILPTFKAEQLMDWGVVMTPQAQAHSGPLALVMLENADEMPTYVLGTENFYTLTRYNWSSYYAMAVIELGQAIKAASQRYPPQISE